MDGDFDADNDFAVQVASGRSLGQRQGKEIIAS